MALFLRVFLQAQLMVGDGLGFADVFESESLRIAFRSYEAVRYAFEGLGRLSLWRPGRRPKTWFF